MNIREEMELDKIKREERLQQFIKEERARVLARRKAIVEKEKKMTMTQKNNSQKLIAIALKDGCFILKIIKNIINRR